MIDESTPVTEAAPEVVAESTPETVVAEPTWQERRAALLAEKEQPKAKAEPEPVVEEPKVEEPPQVDPAAAERDKLIGEFAQKEARLRTLHGKFKAEQAAWKPRVEYAEQFETLLSSDPHAALEMVAKKLNKPFHEVYRDITRKLAASLEDPTPESIARETAEKVATERYEAQQKAAQEAAEEARKATIEKQYTEAVEGFKAELRPEAYPLLSRRDPDAVARAALHEAQQVWAKERKVLDYGEALSILEDRIQAQADQDYQAAAAAKAARATQTPVAVTTAATQVATPTGHQESRPRTLAQSHAQEGGPPKPLDWRERRRRFEQG